MQHFIRVFCGGGSAASTVPVSRWVATSAAAAAGAGAGTATAPHSATVWRPAVGLEVHAQIASRSKLFSAAVCRADASANTRVQLFDAALPGTLPVLNRRCVEAAILTAHALGMTINPVSSFDRKHYFYADLPLGYQITQKRCPLARGGCLHVPLPDGSQLPVPVDQLQLEMDSGKSYHDAANNRSLIDLNRCGVPLMELVLAPVLTSGGQTAACVRELTLLLTALATCSCNMAEGALRVDANVSVRHVDSPRLGVRAEVKNMNSVRSVQRAVDFEIERQIAVLAAGGHVTSETRMFDRATQSTVTMRDKESVQDYRYLPETNLPPLRLSTSSHPLAGLPDIDQLRRQLPELPAAARHRLASQYRLSQTAVATLVTEPGMASYYEKVMAVAGTRRPALVFEFLRCEVLSLLHEKRVGFSQCELTGEQLMAVLDLLSSRQLSRHWLPQLLRELWQLPAACPRQLLERHQWQLVTDRHQLRAAVELVLSANTATVNRYLRTVSARRRQSALTGLASRVDGALNMCAHLPTVLKLIRTRLDTMAAETSTANTANNNNSSSCSAANTANNNNNNSCSAANTANSSSCSAANTANNNNSSNNNGSSGSSSSSSREVV